MNIANLKSRLEVIKATRQFESDILESFAKFIQAASDEELFRASPLRYAEKHNIEEQKAIDLFLYATHAGILDFSWGAICPSCGAFLTTESGLQWLGGPDHCSLCVLDIKTDISKQTEVAFTVSPQIRSIRFHDLDMLDFEQDGLFAFFSTSIALFPEIHKFVHAAFKNAYRAEAGEESKIEVDFDKDQHYMLMIPASHAVAHVPINESAVSHRTQLELLLDGKLVPQLEPVKPGKGEICIKNKTSRTIIVGLLEEARMYPTPPEERSGAIYTVTPYLTGERLINTQSFRELFRSESIPAPGGLEVKNLTLLFTDLKDSTAMYDRIGDFNAYSLVREHFALLKGIVAAHGGAIVKTMGDAIMASFCNPAHALQAAVVMNREIRRINPQEKLKLKIGLHRGHCVAIEQNNQLDFFGQTVNIASRIQGIAEAGEIICSESIFEANESNAVISSMKIQKSLEQVTLKGIDQPVNVYRLN